MITGAGAGIGAATARAFAAAGYAVAVADVDVEAARGVAGSLENAAAYELDVRSRASIESACAEAVSGSRAAQGLCFLSRRVHDGALPRSHRCGDRLEP